MLVEVINVDQKFLLVGDLEGEADYFTSVCQKVFSSTPVLIRNETNEPEVLLKVEASNMVFIRIDKDYSLNFSLSGKIKTMFPQVHVVWIAANNRYALSAFENNLDGYFELPVTETKLGAVKKRLNM
jgi:two-component SAPR family response regulator